MQLTSLTLWEKKKKKSLNNSRLPQIETSRMCPQGTQKWNVMYKRYC